MVIVAVVTADAADAVIWSEVAGDDDAPTLVLIHGSMDRGAGLLKLSRRLDDDYRVVRYDRRGYGRSAPHGGPYDVGAQVGDLFGLLGSAPAVLFGHSFGGNVALAAAEQRPDQILGVGVYEMPQSWQPWWPGSTAGGAALATTSDPEAAAEMFMRGLIGDHRWERLPPSTRAARRAEGVTMVGELRALRVAPPWDGSAITQPVLVMCGSEGQEHHQRSSRDLVDEFGDAWLIEVAGAGHFGPNTHPDEVGEAIRELWTRAVARRDGTPRAT